MKLTIHKHFWPILTSMPELTAIPLDYSVEALQWVMTACQCDQRTAKLALGSAECQGYVTTTGDTIKGTPLGRIARKGPPKLAPKRPAQDPVYTACLAISSSLNLPMNVVRAKIEELIPETQD